jgi:hypothetical protein
VDEVRCRSERDRLPSILELVTLVDVGNYDPAIDTDAFPGTPPGIYLSSSYVGDTEDLIWGVYFLYGLVLLDSKYEGYDIRCVRGEPLVATGPFEESVNSGERVVDDKATGLMWQGCPAGVSGDSCQQGSSTTHTWEEALSYCESLTWAGYDDWRLPDYYELSAIVNYESYEPAIDSDGFPGTPADDFWSSSPNVSDTDKAWSVGFAYGTVNIYDKTNAVDVRCVRGEYAP